MRKMMQKGFYRAMVTLLFCAAFGLHAKGQEYPWTLQYINNMHTLNPAFVGMWDKAGFMISTRKDYVSIDGAAFYQQLSVYTPVKNTESGVGLNVVKRNIGFERQLNISFDYSYQVRLDMYNYLRFGLRAGISNYSPNLDKYQLYPDRVPDPEFLTDVNHQFMTIFGFGGVIFNDDYYISLSVPQVISNTFQANRDGYSSLQEFKTAYLSGGYAFKLPMSVRLRPNLLVVGTVGKPLYFDLSGTVYFPGNLQFGLSMRSNKAVSLSGQYTFANNLRIGFASEYAVFQDISRFQVGTYEILVGYDFNLYRKKNVKPNYF